MFESDFDFYDKSSLKSYNLTSVKYQLSMLDKMDKFTKRHSENVACLVCRICEYLHLNKDFTFYCTVCAYLHDIGKLFIPPEILHKPAKLTDEEYEVIKTHTTIGYKVCMDDIQLRPYAIGARYHHESLDGTGYPEGIKGNQIPLEAQIIKVADEYDALVTKRQYKTHVNITDTLRLLIKDSEPTNKEIALDNSANRTRTGKLNKKVVKVLFKAVIEDTQYEISCLTGYLDFLKEQIKRLSQIEKYRIKMDSSSSEKKKNYFKEGMQMLFAEGENFDNYQNIYKEYQVALAEREKIVADLYKEIKIIKKLRV